MTVEKLIEIKGLASRILQIVEAEQTESAMNNQGSKPQVKFSPVEHSILRKIPELQKKGDFTAADAQRVTAGDQYCRERSPSTFSAILAKWAATGYLTIVSKGSGPKPTIYRLAQPVPKPPTTTVAVKF